ncbi:MAG: glutamine amidotransferase [Gemmatimonadota bacterium]|nr:glutamine amidotransferase [Gemmatimonadota bacterium]
MNTVFEFLFKYRPLVFEQGDFTLAASGSARIWIGVAAVAAIAVTASYTYARGRSTPVERGIMAALRVGLVLLLAFALLQPTLVVSTVVPQQNFVGVLIDDSRSMSLTDGAEEPRSAFVDAELAPGDGSLVDALSERFVLRYFRFSDVARRINDFGELDFSGPRTNLASALDLARQELSGVPLSGLVVVSDGADTGDRPITEALTPLQAAQVPVYTVGLGEEVIEPDIEVGRIEVPRTVLEGTTVMVDVVVTQHGMGSGSVPVIVEDDQRILTEETIELGEDGDPVVARVGFQLDRAGPRRVRFRIPPQPGERVERNNAREVLIEVRGDREKILYFEGEPRFEVKFTRRAVEDDENLQLVILQRTAESKFLRLSVTDSTELRFGFPTSREELYRYRALVLGSVEASHFTHNQLTMIADFVSERGGSLLFLGGRSAFAEGGWAGTPVEEVMPVTLGEPAGGPDGFFSEVRVRPTPAGLAHPTVQLDTPLDEVAERWDSLPPLTIVNPVTGTKPGATTLLAGESPDLASDQVVLAFHRYGRGKAAAFTVQDSWLWQMHADVPVEDRSHQAFWQQMLRWLLDGVPTPVAASLDRERVDPGTALRLTAAVADSSYIEVNDASVLARVTTPTGAIEEVPLSWTVERDGQYETEFRPSEVGDYEVEIVAERGGEVLGSGTTHFRAGPGDDEYFDAGRRTSLLERIADETGGQSYTPRSVASLPDDIAVTGAGVTLVEERDLWDMPAIFLAMLLLMAAEWSFRRLRGLV